MKLFVFPSLTCDMACPGCALAPATRTDARILAPEALARLLETPAAAGLELIVWAGGEPSLLPEGRLAALVATARRAAPQARQALAFNLMATPDWLLRSIAEDFDGEVETSFAWSRRRRAGETDAAWRHAFLGRLAALRAQEPGLRISVFVEVCERLIADGPQALLDLLVERDFAGPGLARAAGQAAGQSSASVFFALGPSVDTGAALVGRNRFTPGPGVAARISPADYERFLLRLAGLLKAMPEAERPWITPVTELLDTRRVLGARNGGAGAAGGGPEPSADGDTALTLTLFPDGSLRAHPLLAEAPDLPRIPAGHPDAFAAMLASSFHADWLEHMAERAAQCAGCPHLATCSGGPSVTLSRDAGGCYGGRRLRDLLLRT